MARYDFQATTGWSGKLALTSGNCKTDRDAQDAVEKFGA
jgi:hypothetical protein